MGCTIEITGENQERFRVLSDKFGQRAALQTLLEEDGTASIDGFISDVEQGDRVNALTFATIDFLVKSKGDNVNILDLQPSDVTDDKLKAAIGQSRNKLERILEDALSEEELSEESIHIASRTFVALENFDELIPKIVDRFKAYQLDTNELNFELDEIIEFENAAENSKERIYNVESTERNSLDNVKPSVKMFLATLPDMYKDADGNLVERLDDIGMVVPVNFSEVYSIILKNLVDHKNMESMYETLENLAPDIPNIQNVLDHLKNGTLESDVGIQVYGRPVNSFENAFFTSFANTKYDYVTVTTQTDRTGIDPYIRSQALKTNKRDPYRELKNKWAARAASIVSLPANIKARTWNNIVGKKFNPTMGMSRAETARYNRQWKDKLENFGNKSALIEAVDALGVIGIDVTVPGLAQLRKKLGVEEFSKFIMDDLHMIADNMMNKNVDIFADEGTTLNKLARAEASVSSDLGASSFMTNKQKQVHPINLPTFVTELINDFNENGEQFESFMDDPMFSKSRILNDFRIKSGRKVTPHKMELGLFDSIYNNDSKKALDYTELDPVSSLATRMKLFFNYRASRPGSNNAVADPTHGWFMVPTPADRSNTPLFKARTLKFDGPVKVSNIFKEGSEFRDWVLDMAQSEFERVEIVRDEFNREEDKSNLVVNYHTAKDAKGNTILGNGGYFNYFPELNQFLAYNKDGSLSQIDFTSPEVLDVLEQAAKEQVQADLQYMEEIGFIDSMGITPAGNPRFSNIGPSEATKTMIADNVVNETNTIKFILNSIVINHELSGMFYGDLAFFNSQTNEDGTVTSSFESANKRAGLAYTPGNKLNVGNTAARENFKVAFVEDVGFSSDYLDIYTETLGNKQGKKYGKINITDGQGFVSLERYAEILSGQGMLSPAMRTTINELKKPASEVQWSKVTETIEPIKGFLHSNRYDGNFDRVMAKSLKYSLFPVVPSAIEDNPTMQQIHQKMEDGIDELVFQSGSKMGTYNVNSMESLGADLPLKTVTMSNYDWRMPQVIPYKKGITENFGSQIRKLMEGNIVDSNDYDGISGKELKEAYQQAISQKLENSFRNLRDSLETDGVTDLDKVVDRILNDLEKNVYKSNSDFINKALEVMENEMGGLETRIPMSFPAIKHKMESVLNSIVRKAVTKQELPGFSGVVYSSLGFNKASINVSRELRPTRMENGVVKPAEVKMSPQYFANTLVQKAKELSKEKGNGRKIAEINAILAQFRNGTFDINRIPQSLRAGVAYRIPTQGKNSIIPITVVGFTPGALTTSIVLPAEVVTQTGMDYDIDKVWIELKHFNYENSSFNEVLADMSNDKGIDNTIINIHNAILTSPHHFVEMSTPNHSDVLDEMRATFEEIYPNGFGGEKFSSLSTQDHFRDANQAGGIFIGIASNANTAHSVFQQLDVSLLNREEGAPELTNQRANVSDESIDNVWHEFSQLKEIFNGDKDLYQQYLDTIFPDSKVKDVVYHGTNAKFNEFLQDNLNYFGTKDIAKSYGNNIFPVLIDIIKPYYEDGGNLSNESYEDLYDKLEESNSDGFISQNKVIFVPKDSEQIHILGSKQDIKQAEEFVKNKNTQTSTGEVNYSGGYENSGKGTPQGDGKDKAMRKIANSSITELVSNKPSSSKTTKDILGDYDGTDGTVMLARNGSLRNKPLDSVTKDLISWANAEGAKFVVGDMPGVDSQFIDYLQEINADFTVYHTGTTPRVSNNRIEFTQEGKKLDTEGVTINGKVVRSLSLTKNRDGGLISEDHIEIQTAAVDNASNPLLGYLNINTITGSTYLFLVEAGLGLKYPTYLMNTPIIRELTKQTRISESTLGTDGAFESALNKLALERDIDLKSVQNQDFDVSQRVLDEVIKKVRDGNPTQVHDAQILKAFLTFRKYGIDMNRVQSALRTDIIGPKQTLAANVIQVENLSKVLGTYSNVNYNKTYPNDSVEPIKTVVINPEKYKNHSIHTYEHRGLWGAIDLVSEFIDDSTPVFKKVLKDFQEGIGGYLAESDIRLLMNDMYAYVLANQTARRDGHHSILASTDADTLSKLLMGENSTAKKVMEAQQEEKRRSMEDVSYMPNRFLMSLSTVMNDSNTGYDLVNFNNTITRALTSDQKTALSNEYYDMITAENAEYLNNLAVELFVYNFSMEGFNRGVNSFSEFIPIELYENYTDGLGGESVVDFYLNSQPDFQDLQSYNTDQFLNLFLRNRGLQLKGLKNLYYRKMSEVKEFLTQNPRVQYFLYNNAGDITLGKRVEGTENQFSGLGGLIGHDNVQVEYHSGNPISEMETPQQVKERLERTGDIEQEEGSNC